MSLTESNSIQLGSTAPKFSLTDTVSDSVKSLQDCSGSKGTLIMFICNHCPFVKHINNTIASLAKEYQALGISFVAISSNDIENYPMDAPELMKKVAEEESYSFPYLYDESQQVAKDYGATCTPDIFLYDENQKLYYHGQLDDSRPGNGIVCDGQDVKTAMDNLLQGIPTKNQKPSIGCNIKWK
jgi:peroxiredoxin